MRILKFINQQLIKDTNMKHLYTSIYHNPGISRAHLSKQTALSKTTVSTLIDELIERNFILDGGAGESGTTGRKPESALHPPQQPFRCGFQLVREPDLYPSGRHCGDFRLSGSLRAETGRSLRFRLPELFPEFRPAALRSR